MLTLAVRVASESVMVQNLSSNLKDLLIRESDSHNIAAVMRQYFYDS